MKIHIKKSTCFVCVLFLFALPIGVSAQASGNAEAPDKQDVMKFLDLMHARTQMEQVLSGMAKQMKLGAEQGFKQKVPDATPEQLAKVDKLFDTMFSSLPMDEMVDAIVPIYQKHLTGRPGRDHGILFVAGGPEDSARDARHHVGVDAGRWGHWPEGLRRQG